MGMTVGTRISVYEIVAAIGVGGMGEVYRATDTKLKRQVAIKVLPTSVAADAERLARFQREEAGYALEQGTKPQTLGVALNDSPAGLLAWIVERPTLARIGFGGDQNGLAQQAAHRPLSPTGMRQDGQSGGSATSSVRPHRVRNGAAKRASPQGVGSVPSSDMTLG